MLNRFCRVGAGLFAECRGVHFDFAQCERGSPSPSHPKPPFSLSGPRKSVPIRGRQKRSLPEIPIHAAIDTNPAYHLGEGGSAGRAWTNCLTRPATEPRPPPGGAESSKQQAALFPILAWFRPYLGELRYVKSVLPRGSGVVCGCRTCTSTSSVRTVWVGPSHPQTPVQPERSRRPNPSRSQCTKDAPAGRCPRKSCRYQRPHHPGEGRIPWSGMDELPHPSRD
jgi:hypothetical protein